MHAPSVPPSIAIRYPIEVHAGMTQNPYETPPSVDATHGLHAWRSFGRSALFLIGFVVGSHIVAIARSGFLRTTRHWLDNPAGSLVINGTVGLLSLFAFAGYRALRSCASSHTVTRLRVSLPLGVAFAVITLLTLSGLTKLIGHEVRGTSLLIELAMYITSIGLAAIVTVELQRLVLPNVTSDETPS
ncbi:hypothetical protein [Rhodopirellula europaea]|uniref:hypothetical protein n=1 Tax=Rhodopirellula europaea TaxID=1263866 RepID=UPI000586BDFC|nr:hypothetical protein [Rhodopirellula europaea]